MRSSFRPIFVVGCQRSGTTALAVMLDRHSRIAMLPETQFFRNHMPQESRRGGARSHEAMVERALADAAIRESRLAPEAVLAFFRPLEPTYPNLFRSLLQAYAREHGRERPGEKSCHHLFDARRILDLYDEARMICIVRDGRDVVRSIRNTPWGKDHPWTLLCHQWNRFAAAAAAAERSLPPDRFTLVRYEALMREPEAELRRLCAFVGEEFEPGQIEAGTGTNVVPDYELGWKGMAKRPPDQSRAGAWRRNSTPEEIAQWNLYMGRWLQAFGYPDTDVGGVPLSRRLAWSLAYAPFLPGVLEVGLGLNNLIRRLRRAAPRDGAPA